MRKGPDYLVWLINSKCRLLFKCEAGVIWITLDSDAWRNNFWFVRLQRHYWWWLVEMLEAAECFLPSLLSLPHLLSYDSSKKYFITSAAPSSQLWLLPFFFSNCPSLRVCIPSHSQPRSTGQCFGSARDMLAKRKVMVFTTAAPQCWQPVLPKWHALFGFPTFMELHSTSSLSRSTPHTHTHTHTRTRTFNQAQSCISCQCATKRSHVRT